MLNLMISVTSSYSFQLLCSVTEDVKENSCATHMPSAHAEKNSAAVQFADSSLHRNRGRTEGRDSFC